MCGIAAIAGARDAARITKAMTDRLRHRGPDGDGVWEDAAHGLALGHRRLSIIDLSDAGAQPMTSTDGRFTLVFNGELYNYLELRAELAEHPFRSHSDTEVVIAAWQRWGEAALDRMLGMFAFVLWDAREQRLVAVRDRFGVKPLYRAELPGGGLVLASEIKALHAAGVPARPDAVAWATYLTSGVHESGTRTFWDGISAVPAGTLLAWSPGRALEERRWYDLAARTMELDRRDEATVREEYRALMENSVALRFRADVPVGINLSGGLDSSVLLGLVHAVQGTDSDVKAFTFVTGDDRYDELPWVAGMLERTKHPLVTCTLLAADVPQLALEIAEAEDEPYGGLPTLAYATLFRAARREGVIVLLDGQGMDEQWAGYDYYRRAGEPAAPVVQGTVDPATRPECLAPELARLAEPLSPPKPFGDPLRDLQLRDALYTKLPRALRFNDRVSMAASTELREPFLDHRLFELALRQPADRKLGADSGKKLLREIAGQLVPDGVRLAPKRALQTPQREWLRGPLRGWAEERLEITLAKQPAWFDAARVRAAWQAYAAGAGDNSYWVWQWLSPGFA